MQTINKRNWRTILTAVTFIALLILIYAIREKIFETIRNLDDVNIWALPLMLVWQVLNYHSYSRLYQHFFVILGERIRYRSMLRVTFELNFVNNVFPSGGVSGFSYFSLRMRDAEVPASKSALVQLARFIMIFVSFQVLLVLGLLMLALGEQVNNLTILIAGSLATLLIVGTLALAFIIGSKQRINTFFTYVTKVINRIIHIFRPEFPETINIARAREVFTELHENYMLLKSNISALRWPFIWALFANIAEVMAVYTVYIAFGELVNPGAVIIAYAVANFAGLISVLPGGVGIYEALMTAILAAAGVPPSLSIPVTIMYRVINMSIQLPPGGFLYYRAINQKRARI